MKSLLVLCFCIIVICFTISTCVGVILATIDILRNPKRFHVESSFEEIPEDFLQPSSDTDSDTDLKTDKFVIS